MANLAAGPVFGYANKMVELPGNLERSTLGDVLGALHRSRVTGALRIDEFGAAGRREHVIYWRDGLIHLIESGGSPPAERDKPKQLAQLESLFGLRHARLSFRVMGHASRRAPEPLGPPEFLHGRRRRRDAEAPERPPRPRPPEPTRRERAVAVLGLSGEPAPEAVRAAFRQLARRWHPDRHPAAGELTRAALCRRFAEISAAYCELTRAPAEPSADIGAR